MLYLVQVLSGLSTRASSSCSSSARASVSLANRRLVIVLPPMLTFLSCSSRTSDIMRSRKMFLGVGEKWYHCLTLVPRPVSHLNCNYSDATEVLNDMSYICFDIVPHDGL